MTKTDLIMALAKEKNLPDMKAKDIVNMIFNGFTKTLKKGGRIEVRGFGTFCVRDYGSYTGRNPKTGKAVKVISKRLPYFKAGVELKKRVDS
jgi:integration host factor subunit beta